MKRYLIYFGYIGTYFRGVQKQHCKGVPVRPLETVQGLLEICLSKLKIKPANFPIVYPSSRTDSGVHALCSTAHTDLDFSSYNIPPEKITIGLNFVLRNAGYNNVCIYETRQVPNIFSARHSATKRTYIYRFAVLKKTVDLSVYSKNTSVAVPIIEQDRCYFIFDPELDLDVIGRTCPKFIGTKDFRSFMGTSKNAKDKITERTLINLELRPGRPLYSCPISDQFDFYEIECTGKSFLYKQVRRIVGSLFALGQKRLSVPEIDYLLNVPAKDSWSTVIDVPPGCGLYLAQVGYNESDMILTEDNQIVQRSDLVPDEADESDKITETQTV